VQESVERAVLAFCGEAVTLVGAGRTDAGVHALSQVAHLDLARTVETDTLRDALNAHLRPHPIAVLEAAQVADDFHARFSALARHYRYRILNRRAQPTLERGHVWHVPQPLDAEAMHAAAQALVGRHDFTTFRSGECQARSPEKTLDRLAVARAGDCVVIEASARSFLHNQVRSMVGSLKLVGLGKWSRGDLERALAARDRKACGPVAPPEGLFLVSVSY
jgi:tRNA pseudouridine38-40 synthase